ncbi:MAG TPA: hypothetical protein VKT20_07130 [Candidatus Dormibacteraeota bacterium]|nr:hypothetical protein [Candidatus Dormibacteraeota bacterium]
MTAIASAVLTVVEFAAGLAITLAGSELLARGLTRLGAKLGFSEGLLGLLSPTAGAVIIGLYLAFVALLVAGV